MVDNPIPSWPGELVDLGEQIVRANAEHQGSVHGVQCSKAAKQEALVAVLASSLGSKLLPDAAKTEQALPGIFSVQFRIEGVALADVHGVVSDSSKASSHLAC